MTVTADASTLMRQAHATAQLYMQQAIADIDELLGKGYAKAHPELIAAYMQTAARDFHTAISAQALDNFAATLSTIDFYDPNLGS